MKNLFVKAVKLISLASMLIALNACKDDTEKHRKLSEITQLVEVIKVKVMDGSNSIPYSGTIEESESVSLSFSVVGNVSRVYVSEGEYVKKGQILAELNNETYKNTYEMTLASLKQAEDAYKRLLPMYKNGNLPEIKLVEIETSLQQAKSASTISKKNIDDCKLYSSVDGIVGKRSIDPGMISVPNVTSISIVKIEKVFAKVPISESEISAVKKGSKAKIKISALNDSEFNGTVEEIGVMADPIAHTYKIKIGISNSNLKIKPGMICNVTIEKLNEIPRLVIPDRAVLVDEQGRNFVYSVNNDKAMRKYVTTGKLLKSGVEIVDGLNDGEEIVISGQQNLVDNSTIKIVNN